MNNILPKNLYLDNYCVSQNKSCWLYRISHGNLLSS